MRIGASGLRSSCASIARNSSFWRSAVQLGSGANMCGNLAEVADHAVAPVGKRNPVDLPLVVLDRAAVEPFFARAPA